MEKLIPLIITLLIIVIGISIALCILIRWRTRVVHSESHLSIDSYVDSSPTTSEFDNTHDVTSEVDTDITSEVDTDYDSASLSSLTGGNNPSPPTDINRDFTQVSTLTNDVIASIDISNFVWMEKTDGLRTVLIIEKGCLWNITKANDYKLLEKDLKSESCVKRSILDTEAYEDRYIVFDALMIEDEDITKMKYTDRVARLTQFVSKVKNILPFDTTPYRSIVSWKDLLEFIKNYRSPYTKHVIDGVILQRTDVNSYFNAPGVPNVYKLKLPSMNTIDFYIRYVKEEGVYYIYLYGNNFMYRTNCRKLPKINRYMLQHTGNDPHRTIPPKGYVLFASPFFNNVSKFKPRIDWVTDGYQDHYITVASELMKDMLSNPMKYDGKIMELSFANDGWVPYRVRDDKFISNSYFIGFDNMSVLFNPINPDLQVYFGDKDNLTTASSIVDVYHKCSHVIRQYLFEYVIGKRKDIIYKANRDSMNNAKNDNDSLKGGNIYDIYGIKSKSFSSNVSEIKHESKPNKSIIPPLDSNRMILTKYAEQISLFDIAGGRGADYFTFCNLGITNLFVTDMDRNALVKYAHKRITLPSYIKWEPLLSSTTSNIHDDVLLNIIAYKLSHNNETLIKLVTQRLEYPTKGFDIIVMNYAIHYICYSHKIVKELARTVAQLLNKSHGVFIVTYIDGDKVLSLMNGKDTLKISPFTLELVDYDKLTSDSDRNEYMNHDSDMQLIKMPLPTIDISGYRIEPLVTNKYISDLDEYLKLEEEFYLCESARDYLKNIPNNETATNYLSLFKARIYKLR